MTLSEFRKISTTKILFSTNSTLISGSWVTVGDLLPFSTYRAYINASNSVGFVLSNYVTMTTSSAGDLYIYELNIEYDIK